MGGKGASKNWPRWQGHVGESVDAVVEMERPASPYGERVARRENEELEETLGWPLDGSAKPKCDR